MTPKVENIGPARKTLCNFPVHFGRRAAGALFSCDGDYADDDDADDDDADDDDDATFFWPKIFWFLL